MDEEAVHAQSAILDKIKPVPLSFLFITMFSARMRFSSVQKTWLARESAQRQTLTRFR
jgi:hypothetical protein